MPRAAENIDVPIQRKYNQIDLDEKWILFGSEQQLKLRFMLRKKSEFSFVEFSMNKLRIYEFFYAFSILVVNKTYCVWRREIQ